MPEPLSIIAFAGYAALYAAARRNSGVSDEAQVFRQSACAVVESAERSFALFGSKETAISQIWALVAASATLESSEDEDQPIDRIAASIAEEFIRVLPENVPLPEFASEPDGSISLDWIQSRCRLFTLSIGRSSRLAYAWIDGADQGHAVARFDGTQVPERVLEGILSIVNHGHASLRVA